MMDHAECVPDVSVIVNRVDSPGYQRIGKIVARLQGVPFPVAVCWDKSAPDTGWAFFLPGELTQATIALV